jgi:hypothetical protein
MFSSLITFAQQNSVNFEADPEASAAFGEALGLAIGALLVFALFSLLLYSVIVISAVRLLHKAGEGWWKALIPIYSNVVFLKVIKRPTWWIVFYLVPWIVWMIPDEPVIVMVLILPFLVVAIINSFDLAKAFGRGAGFAIGMILLPLIFLPILAFGNSKYVYGDAGSASPSPNPVPPTPAPGGQAQVPTSQPVDSTAPTTVASGVGVVASESSDPVPGPDPSVGNQPFGQSTPKPVEPLRQSDTPIASGQPTDINPVAPEETPGPEGNISPEEPQTAPPDQFQPPASEEDKDKNNDPSAGSSPGQNPGPSL